MLVKHGQTGVFQRTRGAVLVPTSTVVQKLRHVSARISLTGEQAELLQAEAAEKVEHVPWHQRSCAGFVDVKNTSELTQAIVSGQSQGKFVVVELYTGWCASCKASFPSLCKLPQDEKLRDKFLFYKANVEEETLFWWVKMNGISGLPHIAIFSPQGEKLIGMSSSFKKMPQVRAALHTILDNPDAKTFTLDPQGDLVPTK